MIKSKTKIEKQMKKKTNSLLVKTILLAKKNNKWLEVAKILSGPRKRWININLEEIDKQTQDGEKVVIPGKVLSQGEITKKIKIVALDFSERAREKLLNSKREISSIIEEIQKNPETKGIKILKWQK